MFGAAGQLFLTLAGVSLLFACLQANGAMEAAASPGARATAEVGSAADGAGGMTPRLRFRAVDASMVP